MKTGPWPQLGRVSPAEQKAFILKQGEEGTPVVEICRNAGISQATCFNWKKKYGGLLLDKMRRLSAGLEHEFGIPHSTIQIERETCGAACVQVVARRGLQRGQSYRHQGMRRYRPALEPTAWRRDQA